jgi:REP element-mobilizing transposase RayT
VDHYSVQSYEHRRQWVVDRIRLLSSLFAIDVCAYAVMSNHYHLVLKMCPEQLDDLSIDEVINRWCSLFKGPVLIQNYRNVEALTAAERAGVSDIANVWRKKLCSISWFMRCLNQPIAHQANREDECTGKFWESRFTSQALKSEEALLSCMAYVDLNPVRAGVADSPEESEFTSVRERLSPAFDVQQAIDDQTECGDLREFALRLKPLLPFDGHLSIESLSSIPFDLKDYLSLVDWTGRVVRSDKRGYISNDLPPILKRLDISVDQWHLNTTQFETLHRKQFNRIESALDTG